jgi:hypothetical protein
MILLEDQSKNLIRLGLLGVLAVNEVTPGGKSASELGVLGAPTLDALVPAVN